MSATDDTFPADSTPTATPDQASHHPAHAATPTSGDHAPADPWERVTERMRQDIGEAAWRNWIKPLRVSRLEDGTLTLEANSTLARERVTSQYADRLRVISAAEYGGVRKVEVRVAAQAAPRMSQQKPAAKHTGEALGAGLDPRYTFSNFVVGKPNELAFAVARRTAESATVAFNPLFLYGGVGLGKTHLMHAIAWHIREQDPSRHVVYLSAEKFMYRFVQALRFRDTMSFKEQFRSVDVLMIDDVQFISGKDSTQEEFFHTGASTHHQQKLNADGDGIAIALFWPFHTHCALIAIISRRWRTAPFRGPHQSQYVGDSSVGFVVRSPQRAGSCQEGWEGGHLTVP